RQFWGDDDWQDNSKSKVFVLSGSLEKRRDGRGSVKVTSLDRSQEGEHFDSQHSYKYPGSICHLEFRHITFVPHRTLQLNTEAHSEDQHPRRHLIAVRTMTGMRHQVRAMLSHVGHSPIVGDLRYGSSKTGQEQQPLPDKSVALHARTLYMPTVQLGGTDLVSAPFVAPIPSTWKAYFDLSEDDIHQQRNRQE
ncbi:MAG: hypothetical protein SGILL_010455, partial [Bacillariaceae sp.]